MFSTVFKPFHSHRNADICDYERGNAMIYVLLAIALFGVLTATLSGQNNDADGQDIDDEQIEFYASELLEYSAAAKSVIDQMLITGSTIDDLDFINPTSAAFDTPPHIHKVFHPSGGGLTYIEAPNENTLNVVAGTGGWRWQNLTNVEWTPTASNDIMLSAFQISQAICAKINSKITGNETIPTVSNQIGRVFSPSVLPNEDLTSSNCSGCDGYPALCVRNSAGNAYNFYTILAAR